MTNCQLFINDSEIELSNDTIVAISSKINDLSDLTNHNSNLTNRFKVPKTKNNIEILEASDQVQSASFMPYRKNSARLLMEGVNLIQSGYAVIESADDFYNITVYSGNVDFFDLIEGLKLTDLDTSAISHTFDFSTVTGSYANTESSGYKYPIINYGQLNNADRVLDPSELRLFVFCSYLFKNIITEQDFTYDGNIFTATNFVRLMLSASNSNKICQYYDKLGRITKGEQFDIAHSVGIVSNNWMYLLSGETWTVTLRIKFRIDVWGTGTSVFGCTYLGAVIYSHSDADASGLFYKTVTATINGPASGSLFFDFFDVTGELIDGEISFQSSNANTPEIFAHIHGTGLQVGDNITGNQIYIAFDFVNAYGFTVMDVAKELPDMTQKDFIKAIGHVFGLVFKTSSLKSKIYVKQFSEIVDNIPNAVDWTYKMDMTDIGQLYYRIGNYSQLNNCKYKDDTNDTIIPDQYGNGEILLDDQTLPSKQTTIQLPFAATINEKKLIQLDVPSIRRIDDSTGEWSVDTVPRILYNQVETISGDPVTFDDGVETPTTTNDIALPWFIREDKSNNLGFTDSILPDNYAALTTVLNKSKKILRNFYLTASDVYKFTEGNPLTEGHFIPVYLHQYGAYFYVSKINNYKGEGLTQVELIRIGDEDLSLLDVCYNIFYPGETFPSSNGFTLDAGFLIYGNQLVFDSTTLNPSTAIYNTFTRIKTDKCYKLIIIYDNTGGDDVQCNVTMNGGSIIFPSYVLEAGLAKTLVLGTFSISSLSGDFLNITLETSGSSTLHINKILIVSCDCTDYD